MLMDLLDLLDMLYSSTTLFSVCDRSALYSLAELGQHCEWSRFCRICMVPHPIFANAERFPVDSKTSEQMPPNDVGSCRTVYGMFHFCPEMESQFVRDLLVLAEIFAFGTPIMTCLT